MEPARPRGKARPAAVAGARKAPPPGAGRRAPEGHEQLKDLIKGYKGFGILSLIRALMFRGWRSCLLALTGVVLLLGQWTGPVGFIAFKVTTEKYEFCERGGGLWAQFIMGSVALIYFARLSLAALSHKQQLPAEFAHYKIPKWWGIYRHTDLVVTSLLYDTFIFLANLLVVFQDRAVEQMIVDVLALEFFTLIDDEFKAAVLEYDSTFLYDMLIPPPGPSELSGPQRQPDDYTVRSSSYMAPPVRRAPLREALFDPAEDGGETGLSGTAGCTTSGDEPKTCVDVACNAAIVPLKMVLLIVRAACRIGGPLIAFVSIVYGPYCLGPP